MQTKLGKVRVIARSFAGAGILSGRTACAAQNNGPDVTIFDMSFARIFNAAVGSALFRVAAEDFCVNEILDLIWPGTRRPFVVASS